MPDKSDQTSTSLFPPGYIEQPDIPDKLYYRIGEVCRITGLAAHVLRFWESEFPQVRPKRTKSGQRLYVRSDINQILTIKQLLYEKKYTLKGARKHLGSRSRTRPEDSGKLLEDIAAELVSIRDMLR